jgi:hypothetical protein
MSSSIWGYRTFNIYGTGVNSQTTIHRLPGFLSGAAYFLIPYRLYFRTVLTDSIELNPGILHFKMVFGKDLRAQIRVQNIFPNSNNIAALHANEMRIAVVFGVFTQFIFAEPVLAIQLNDNPQFIHDQQGAIDGSQAYLGILPPYQLI